MNKHISLAGAISKQAYLYEQTLRLDQQFRRSLDDFGCLTDEIAECVKGGETTGNIIRDVLLAAGYRSEEEDQEFFHSIQRGIASEKGSPVLWIVVKDSPVGTNDDRKHETLRLGILDDDSLVIDVKNAKCTFPVSKEARTEDYSFGLVEVSSEPSNILEDGHEEGTRDIVFMGTESIVNYFRSVAKDEQDSERYFHVLYAMAKGIGLELPEIPELTAEMRTSLDAILSGSVIAWGETHPHVD